MSDYYVVSGEDLLATYRKFEHDNDQHAFIKQKDIRRRLLSAKRIPSGTLNLAAFAYIVRSTTMKVLDNKRITTLNWRIPVCTV